VATEPLGVTIWTDEMLAGMDSVVGPPAGVRTDETMVGSEVGTTVDPDGVTTVTELGDGTELKTGMLADW
jgi:hypothetical protein